MREALIFGVVSSYIGPLGPPSRGPRAGGETAAAALALTRPRNCALAGLSVAVGALCGDGLPLCAPVALAGAGAALIAGAGNGLNDVVDLAADRVNRPRRPLPSGRLSTRWALGQSAALGATGLALAFAAGVLPGAIAAGVATGLAVYSAGLKRSGLPGNLLVSLLAAATFPYGAAAAGGWGRWWIPAGFAFLYHLGREITKGVEDAPGDRIAGVGTLALRLGPRTASRVAAALFLTVAAAAPLPAAAGLYGAAYLAPVVFLELFLAAVALRLWRGLEEGVVRTSRRLLAGMVLGLLAVVLGEVVDRS